MNFDVKHQCLILTMDHGKVNALGQPLRQYLCEGLAKAASRDEVRWVLLRGTDRFFSAGADLAEVANGTANAAPSVASVLDAIEKSPKPVVALLHGAALGGGFELALACHARLATATAKVGFPESKLGLIPGAGGTQRLPRAIGVAAAMEVMLSGKAVAAQKYEGTPLVQACVESADLAMVWPAAQAVLVHEAQLLRELQMPQGAAAAAPKKASDVSRALQSLVGVTFPTFETGLEKEYAAFCALREGNASKALRHMFLAEQRAVKLDGVEAATADELKQIGIVGAGTMGLGIAIAVLDCGKSALLVDRSEEALQRAQALIAKHYVGQVKKGRLTEAQAAARQASLEFSAQLRTLASADIVIEAVFEDYAVKEAVLRDISATVGADAIIATNTSALDVNRLADCVSNVGRFVGLHFFSPANIMRLVEVVQCRQASDSTLALSFALVKSLGKLPVLAGVCDGFIGNRMYAKYNAAANDLINMGASPAQVDAALERFGFAMGIFKVGDLAGLELSWAGRKRRAQENPDVDYAVFADRLCEIGRFGQKTQAGWYRYEEGARHAITDPIVENMIELWRADRSYPTRAFSDEEIVGRCMCALAAEGKRLLHEGIAQCMGDIDVVYVNGYGFPREQGGPMFYAESLGWEQINEQLRRIASDTTIARQFWLPD